MNEKLEKFIARRKKEAQKYKEKLKFTQIFHMEKGSSRTFCGKIIAWNTNLKETFDEVTCNGCIRALKHRGYGNGN